MAGITIVNNEGTAAGSRPGPSNHGAWLAELESAQWQQRMRYQGGGAAPRGPGAGAPDNAPATPRQPAQAGAAAQPLQEPGHAERPAPATAAGAHGSGPGAAAAAGGRTARGEQAPFALAPFPFQQPQRGAPGAPQGAPRMPVPRAPVQWQAQHAHVLAGAEGVRLWLRDARYGKGDGLRLLRALRGQFAHMGLRLAGLTLNGESITGSGQPAAATNDSFQRGE